MALLAAVAHVDYAAWRYLLEKHCSVNFGVEGEPVYEKKIPIRYVVTLDLRDQTGDFGTHEFDLVFFFGVHQRLHPSGEYREALQQIAALDKNPLRSKSDFDFDVPVRVDFDGSYGMNELVDVGIAEKIVQQQWQKYEVSGESQSTARGEWHCTFVLERMIVDLVDQDMTTAMGAALKTLLHQNTWFSRVSLCLMRHLMMPAQSYGQLVSSVFDSTRRLPQLARTSCHPSFVPASGGSDPLQLGEIVVTWAPDVHIHYVGAMCSAMVHNQMSKNLSLQLWMKTNNGEINQRYWKWLAYALFLKRARASSAVESLAMMKVCSMSVSDMEAFTSIASSDHPARFPTFFLKIDR
ncbi:hypothetical protein PF005_g21877 [Phytophthora fragariae]|uniref:Uncharacterized protein n=1 Tax=Phytophthora fragariae TaxID=53985 RepID=A0A6A3DUD9_9STRA|nr:hypothetical protein PF009_g26857 [Phytophthora fragariae]KAE9183946.1 hypothetical protein PF005_g21877 [Phytophthora fragariae]KAE9280532.1 hypothetical protein PF001_g24186 [Phytophthora fragariae]